jgi:glucose/arabinose dehydrogenase
MKRLVMLIAVLIVVIFIVIKYTDYSSIMEFLSIISSQDHELIEINPNYKNRINVELIIEGLSLPTSMTFVGNNSILVVEKDRGNVRLVSNGILQKEPVYTVKNISNEKEQGLLGIAATLEKSVSNNKIPFKDPNFYLPKHQNASINSSSAFVTQFTNGSTYKIYLYVTEKTIPSPRNDYTTKQYSSNPTTQNRVYEYDWIGPGQGNLSNPHLLLELPSGPDPYHIGGKMHMDKQDNLYIIIGDLVTINNTLQNYPGGKNKSISIPNNSSVIFRINPLTESMIPTDNPFYSYNNTILDSAKFYYSYGIRNGFGLDTDPLTGKLWNTENGENNYDEINLVQPGFNSGWNKIMGPMNRNNNTLLSDLIMLNGSHYSDPKFSWRFPVGVTDIEFLESSKLGKDLENNMFVGDINNGNLYIFKVNPNRSGIDIQNSLFTSEKESENGLQDLVADNKNELEKIIFAKGFEGRITDIETGTDGSLYILTYFDGRIYRISAAEK